MKILILICVLTLLITGCVSFHPKPLSPSETASAFEARTLDNPGLKAFLEANLHHELTPWPLKSWDFSMLTLAAFYYHPDLDVARAKWGVAEAVVITAGGRPNPGLGLSPQFNADAAAGISPWTLGFNLDIPIETAGKRGYRIAQVKHLSEAARLNIATTAWQVRSRLRASLLNLYAGKQAEPILKKQQAIQEEIVRLLEERLAVGEASQPDVTEAHISLNQARLLLLEVQKQHAEARVQLADAVGLPVDALNGFEIALDFLDRLPQNLPSRDMRRQALLNRPDILSALVEYAASQLALQLEIARQYPDIHLGPGYAWDQGDNKWSLSFSISLPVLNRNEGPIAETEARRKETAARFTALQARVIGEVDRTRVGYRATLQKLETVKALLSDREIQLQTLQAMFDIGETDRPALLGTQLELVSAEMARLDTWIKAQQSLGLLEDAVQLPFDDAGPMPSVPETDDRIKEEDNK